MNTSILHISKVLIW